MIGSPCPLFRQAPRRSRSSSFRATSPRVMTLTRERWPCRERVRGDSIVELKMCERGGVIWRLLGPGPMPGSLRSSPGPGVVSKQRQAPKLCEKAMCCARVAPRVGLLFIIIIEHNAVGIPVVDVDGSCHGGKRETG